MKACRKVVTTGAATVFMRILNSIVNSARERFGPLRILCVGTGPHVKESCELALITMAAAMGIVCDVTMADLNAFGDDWEQDVTVLDKDIEKLVPLLNANFVGDGRKFRETYVVPVRPASLGNGGNTATTIKCISDLDELPKYVDLVLFTQGEDTGVEPWMKYYVERYADAPFVQLYVHNDGIDKRSEIVVHSPFSDAAGGKEVYSFDDRKNIKRGGGRSHALQFALAMVTVAAAVLSTVTNP